MQTEGKPGQRQQVNENRASSGRMRQGVGGICRRRYNSGEQKEYKSGVAETFRGCVTGRVIRLLAQ